MAEADGDQSDRDAVGDRSLTTDAGGPRPVGMATLDAELHQLLHDTLAPVESDRERPTAVGDHAGVVARVHRHLLRRLLVADVIGLVFAALLGPLIISALSNNPDSTASHSAPVSLFDLAMIPLFVMCFTLYGLYRGTRRRISTSVFTDLRNIVHALMISGFLYAIVAYVAKRNFGAESVTVAKITTMCLVAAFTVPLARAAAFGLLGRTAAGAVPVIVVGTGKLAQTVASHLRAHSSVNFVGFVDDNPLGRGDVIGGLDDLPELCRRYGVARVAVCFSRTHPERTTEMLKGLTGQVGVSIVPRYYELITSRSRVEDLSGLPMVDIAPASLSAGARFLKRSFDVVVSSLILVAASPALVVVAAVIKATSDGPVFFRQVRMGRDEKPFSMMKFRTMCHDAESRRHELDHLNEMDGPLFKVRDDPRVTRVGRLLRRTSLDEFPQLINVWKGDMSLVGPRPFVVAEALEIEGWARKRFEARPGMTGLWQVSGRNELSHLELCRLDYLYVASWSFWWDVQILWQTPATVLMGRGAS
ncbi:MAG TPA: sugar transferase [Acidimicrobiales bacterium]|nr:sugar transferase [Acidimicrobiales bacterium]